MMIDEKTEIFFFNFYRYLSWLWTLMLIVVWAKSFNSISNMDNFSFVIVKFEFFVGHPQQFIISANRSRGD